MCKLVTHGLLSDVKNVHRQCSQCNIISTQKVYIYLVIFYSLIISKSFSFLNEFFLSFSNVDERRCGVIV